MLIWVALLVFAIPLVHYLMQLASEKKTQDKKLEKIQKKLKELEQKDKSKD